MPSLCEAQRSPWLKWAANDLMGLSQTQARSKETGMEGRAKARVRGHQVMQGARDGEILVVRQDKSAH